MATIILVHGAWLDASCWGTVAEALRTRGHTVVTPDLPGHGRDTTSLADCSLEAYADRVLLEVDAARNPVLLVGHSMAGVVISTVAERRPDRIQRLVYVAAYLLGDGETIEQQQDPDSLVPGAMRPAADWSSVALDPARMREVFFADVPEALRAGVISASAPEPSAPFGTPLRVTGESWGRVPRAYIRTSQDRAVTPALQALCLAARPCDPVITMDSGHAPFLAQPDVLAHHLHMLASSSS